MSHTTAPTPTTPTTPTPTTPTTQLHRSHSDLYLAPQPSSSPGQNHRNRNRNRNSTSNHSRTGALIRQQSRSAVHHSPQSPQPAQTVAGNPSHRQSDSSRQQRSTQEQTKQHPQQAQEQPPTQPIPQLQYSHNLIHQQNNHFDYDLPHRINNSNHPTAVEFRHNRQYQQLQQYCQEQQEQQEQEQQQQQHQEQLLRQEHEQQQLLWQERRRNRQHQPVRSRANSTPHVAYTHPATDTEKLPILDLIFKTLLYTFLTPFDNYYPLETALERYIQQRLDKIPIRFGFEEPSAEQWKIAGSIELRPPSEFMNYPEYFLFDHANAVNYLGYIADFAVLTNTPSIIIALINPIISNRFRPASVWSSLPPALVLQIESFIATSWTTSDWLTKRAWALKIIRDSSPKLVARTVVDRLCFLVEAGPFYHDALFSILMSTQPYNEAYTVNATTFSAVHNGVHKYKQLHSPPSPQLVALQSANLTNLRHFAQLDNGTDFRENVNKFAKLHPHPASYSNNSAPIAKNPLLQHQHYDLSRTRLNLLKAYIAEGHRLEELKPIISFYGSRTLFVAPESIYEEILTDIVNRCSMNVLQWFLKHGFLVLEKIDLFLAENSSFSRSLLMSCLFPIPPNASVSVNNRTSMLSWLLDRPHMIRRLLSIKLESLDGRSFINLFQYAIDVTNINAITALIANLYKLPSDFLGSNSWSHLRFTIVPSQQYLIRSFTKNNPHTVDLYDLRKYSKRVDLRNVTLARFDDIHSTGSYPNFSHLLPRSPPTIFSTLPFLGDSPHPSLKVFHNPLRPAASLANNESGGDGAHKDPIIIINPFSILPRPAPAPTPIPTPRSLTPNPIIPPHSSSTPHCSNGSSETQPDGVRNATAPGHDPSTSYLNTVSPTNTTTTLISTISPTNSSDPHLQESTTSPAPRLDDFTVQLRVNVSNLILIEIPPTNNSNLNAKLL